MQREGIEIAISLQVVPGQRHPRHWDVATAKALETGFSALLNSIEINHHRPGALSPFGGVFLEFLRPRSKGVGVFLEILPGVITLTLDRLREARIDPEQSREAQIQLSGQLRMLAAQMAGAAGAVIAVSPGHGGRLQPLIDRFNHLRTFITAK